MKIILVLLFVTSFHGVECAVQTPITRVIAGAEGGLDSSNITWKYVINRNYTPPSSWDGQPFEGLNSHNVQDWTWVKNQPAEGWYTDLAFDDSTWESGLAILGGNSTAWDGNETRTPYIRTEWKGDKSSIFMRREVTIEGPIDVDTLIIMETNDDDYEFYINGVLAAGTSSSTHVFRKTPLSAAAKAALKIGCGEKNLFAVRAFEGGGVSVVDVGLYSSEVNWPCGNPSENCYQDAGGDPTKCVLSSKCSGQNYTADNTTGKCRGPSYATPGNGLPCPLPHVDDVPSSGGSGMSKTIKLLLFIGLPILVLLLLLLAAIIVACLLYRRRKKGKNSYVSINSDPIAPTPTPRAAVATPSQYQPSLPRIPVSGMNVRNNIQTSGY